MSGQAQKGLPTRIQPPPWATRHPINSTHETFFIGKLKGSYQDWEKGIFINFKFLLQWSTSVSVTKTWIFLGPPLSVIQKAHWNIEGSNNCVHRSLNFFICFFSSYDRLLAPQKRRLREFCDFLTKSFLLQIKKNTTGLRIIFYNNVQFHWICLFCFKWRLKFFQSFFFHFTASLPMCLFVGGVVKGE